MFRTVSRINRKTHQYACLWNGTIVHDASVPSGEHLGTARAVQSRK